MHLDGAGADAEPMFAEPVAQFVTVDRFDGWGAVTGGLGPCFEGKGDIGRQGLPTVSGIAAATALPELCTGLAAVRMGDYQLAFGDILGGNAFLPILFLLASLLSGQAIVAQAGVTDIYLAGLGALLTVVYMFGIVCRPSRTVARMGLDSAVVLLLCLLGMAGLVAIATS